MSKKTIFRGVCTALITPFRNGEIDYPGLKKLIEFQIEGGVGALLINGTTGESATLTEKEKQELIAFAVREVGERVPLIAGTGSNSTQKALKLSEFAADVGVDGVLVVTPYYNKASAEGLIEHYKKIADAVDVPTILYNVPSRTGVNIPLSVYNELANHKNIVAVKEASASVSDMAKLCAKCGDRLDIYSGNDDLILPTLSLGSKGVISVLSNILPKEVGEICRLWFEGKADEARALQLRLLPLINAIFSEVNPIPIKALMAREGFCAEEYRLPLCPMSEEKKKELFGVYDKFKY
ncbi:MAG: 4-hydroxy-tetrahydrodipicolinate synthase [Clostridia bacterium]|nr:4-hydroxy-tetrahydrodipicolinate synthase [Clostridia bacterium]